MRCSLAWLLVASLALSATARAQTPARSGEDPCFRARAAPGCTVFFLTNAGLYARPGRGKILRAMVDWGVMVNLDPHTAVGGSWFVTLDEDNFGTGPMARFRYWFPNDASLDVGIGLPLSAGNDVRRGSVYSLVKYNPVHWFGVAVRPEYVRRTVYTCTPDCTARTTNSGRVYGGVELSGLPGLLLSLGAGAALATLIAIVAAGGGFD